MSRKIIVISTLFILLCTVLASCGNNISTVETYEISNERSLEAAKGSLDKDGSYTVKKGDLYIGINYGFEDGEYWELMTVCKKGIVVDCARNSGLERFMYKEEYLGSTYEQAFKDFYTINKPVEDHGDPVKITLIIMEDEKSSKYEKVLERIKNEISPGASTVIQTDDEWHFDEVIVNFTLDYVARMEEEENRKAEDEEREARNEAERIAKEEAHLKEEEERRKEEEKLFLPVSSVAEIKERKALGVNDFTLSSDLVIDMNAGMPVDIKIDCAGHSVIVKGVFKENVETRGIELCNASSVDMSDLKIDPEAFNDEDHYPENGISEPKDQKRLTLIEIIDTGYKSVKFPADIPNRDDYDTGDQSPFEGYFIYEISDEGDREYVMYACPLATVEARHEQEVAVVTEILTKGDAYDILGEDYRGEYILWTDVTVDVGDAVLPDQDYMGISLKPGAKLTINGSITLTGGILRWTVCEADQLDIRGLTLIKKHPSPDMVKITYNSEEGLDTSLLKARAERGTIKFVKSETSYDISIW